MKIVKKVLLLAFCVLMTLNAFNVYASQAPMDGSYKVELSFSGGSGKVTAISPTELTVSDQKMTAKIILTSSTYTYMIVDGVYYYNTATAGENSTFIIPISALDTEIKITACTEAMSTPHEIDYIIKLSSEGTTSTKNTNETPLNEGSTEVIANDPKEVTATPKENANNVAPTENHQTNEDVKTEPTTEENMKEETSDNTVEPTTTGMDINKADLDQEASSKSNDLNPIQIVLIIVAGVATLMGVIVLRKRD